MISVVQNVTIANGASLSAGIDLRGYRISGLVMPAAWTAANLTFQASHDNGTTWNNLHDEAGTEKTITAAAARYQSMAGMDFWRGIDDIKIRSGTAGTPVVQLADRVISLILIEDRG